jgi:hypothetical protein
MMEKEAMINSLLDACLFRYFTHARIASAFVTAGKYCRWHHLDWFSIDDLAQATSVMRAGRSVSGVCSLRAVSVFLSVPRYIWMQSAGIWFDLRRIYRGNSSKWLQPAGFL